MASREMQSIATASPSQRSPVSSASDQARQAVDVSGEPARQRKKPRMRREKYTARACVECQQRKVKCSGENTCSQCRNRNITCVYGGSNETNRGARVKRKRGDHSSEDPQESPPGLDVCRTQHFGSHGDNMMGPDESVQSEMQYAEPSLLPNGQTSLRGVEIPMTPKSTTQMLEELDLSSSKLDMVHACDGETDTFEAILLQSQSLSLSSQLTSLRKLLGLESISIESKNKEETQRMGLTLELPSPSSVRHLLDVYFRDYDSYMPSLDQIDIERRIFDFLSLLGYDDSNHSLSLDPAHFALAALVCNVLAMAACLDPDSTNSHPRPGWPLYIQGCRLIQHCSSLGAVDLDVVRYYAVGSGYLMHSECLLAATRAISMAIQLAAKAKLNNQDAWSDCSEEEILSRKKLWWTIYFMDRRIGQKNGTAYLIRDSEVGVDDFSSDVPNRALSQVTTQRRASKSPHPVSLLNSDSRDYLQVLVDLGRLWGQIWDRFFAVTAPNLGDWQEIEIVDKRIVALQRQLPQHLSWSHDSVASYAAGGETESQVRRRLITFTRINTLRLIIRQNPLLDKKNDLDTKHFCADLASRIIEAIGAFRRMYPCIRPSGYFMTASLVECICQLVPLLQVPDLTNEKTAAVMAFRTAYTLLVDLSRTEHGAKRAIRALKKVFHVGEVISLFRTLVAETEQHDQSTDEILLSGSQQRQSGLGELPLEMGNINWPPTYEFLPTPSTDCAGANFCDDYTSQSQFSQMNATQNQNSDVFDTSALDRMVGDDNLASSHCPGDLDLDCDAFMYGEFGSHLFA